MLLALTLCSVLTAAPPPRNVYVGVYLNDVSDLDLKAGHFKADLRVWVKWLGDEKDVPQLTFENAELESKEEAGRESDAAWHSVKWRVQGTFRGDFPLQAFPFDRQTLPVILGLSEDEGVLVPDLGASGMSPAFSITGWSYEPYFSARTEHRLFRSDLGSVAEEGKNAKQKLAIFSVEMLRPFGPYLLKFALPLALILIIALLTLLLPAERLDVRSAMGITALLACFAFHYTQAGTLPDVTYVVAADQLFLGSYLFVAGTLFVSVIAYRLHEKRPVAARRLDRAGLWALPGITAAFISSLVSTSLAAHEREVEVVKPPEVARPSLPVLRAAVATLDSPGGGGQFPSTRGALVTRGSDGQTIPVLAERAPSMTNDLVRLLPDGGMKIRWRVRPHSKWSDGSFVTSDDLQFSLTLVADSKRVEVTRIDERTIDVSYSERRPDWLHGFTVFQARQARLIPEAGRDAIGRATSEGKLPSAGPWKLERWEPKERVVLNRNEAFAGPRPTFERVELTRMEPVVAARALIAGELDVIPSLTPDAYELLRGERKVRVLEQPGDLVWMLVPRLDREPWSSLEARRSLLAVLNRKGLVDALAPLPAVIASGWRAKPSLPVPTAGPLGRTTLTLAIPPIASEDQPHALLARRLVADLAKSGITVTLVETPQLMQAVARGEFEDLALLSRDTADPGRFMNVPSDDGRPVLDHVAGDHFDEEMLERYDAWATSLYAERKDFLSFAMQEAWFGRLPMVPLIITSRLAAVRADLVGPNWGNADSLWWNVGDWRY